MKKFEELLGYTQEQLKNYLCSYLCATGYKVDKGDGYVFAKGDIPVLLIAHMDTARNKEIPHTILKEQTTAGVRLRAVDTLIGGDDRCGVWMIINIIKKAKCHVLFLEDEEIGCIGAHKFEKTKHMDYIADNISFMIELDRRGSNDCVYYRNDNRDFVKYIEEKTGTKEATGSMSDISVLMPTSKVAGVNLSCGYHNEHTKEEYIMMDEMNDMMKRVTDFLTTETEFPTFEFIEKKWTFASYGSGYRQTSFDDYGFWSRRKPKTLGEQALDDLGELTLKVTLGGAYDGDELEAKGSSKAECWATLFLENEELSFSMIEDYFFL